MFTSQFNFVHCLRTEGRWASMLKSVQVTKLYGDTQSWTCSVEPVRVACIHKGLFIVLKFNSSSLNFMAETDNEKQPWVS